MKILVCCEFSGVVRNAFRKQGFEAYSLDILPTENHSEWHIQDDALKHLADGWDMIIAHPPCTYLAVSGNKWFKTQPNRYEKMLAAVEFVKQIYNAPVKYVAIENPVGRLSSMWRKPDQYVQPFWFGDPVRKKTGLWLKNLPKLIPTDVVEPEIVTVGGKKYSKWWIKTCGLPLSIRSWERARTFPGIADAMAEQWGAFLKKKLAEEVKNERNNRLDVR